MSDAAFNCCIAPPVFLLCKWHIINFCDDGDDDDVIRTGRPVYHQLSRLTQPSIPFEWEHLFRVAGSTSFENCSQRAMHGFNTQNLQRRGSLQLSGAKCWRIWECRSVFSQNFISFCSVIGEMTRVERDVKLWLFTYWERVQYQSVLKCVINRKNMDYLMSYWTT